MKYMFVFLLYSSITRLFSSYFKIKYLFISNRIESKTIPCTRYHSPNDYIIVFGKWSALYRSRLFLFRKLDIQRKLDSRTTPHSIFRSRHLILHRVCKRQAKSEWKLLHALNLIDSRFTEKREIWQKINLSKKAERENDRRRWAALIYEPDCNPHIILYSLPTSMTCLSYGCTRSRAPARYYYARKVDVRRARPRNIPAT